MLLCEHRASTDQERKEMKFAIVVVLVLVGIGGLFMLTSKDASEVPATPKLTMQTIQNDVSNGAKFIDIRTAEEFADGHIDGAQNITLQDIQDGKMSQGDKSKTIYVYCQTGSRSKQAAFILKNLGYTHVVDLGSIAHVQAIGGSMST